MDHLLSKEKDVRETSEDSREDSGSVLRDHLVVTQKAGEGVRTDRRAACLEGVLTEQPVAVL